MQIQEAIRTTLINGVLPLCAAFIGVWSGREVQQEQIKSQQEVTRSNAKAISELTNNMTLLTIQVEKMAATLPRDMAGIEIRLASVEQWKVGIQDDRTKRGEIIPRLQNDLAELRQRIDRVERRRF